MSLHEDASEIVNSLWRDNGQRYVRPNNAGVGVEGGVRVRQSECSVDGKVDGRRGRSMQARVLGHDNTYHSY